MINREEIDAQKEATQQIGSEVYVMNAMQGEYDPRIQEDLK